MAQHSFEITFFLCSDCFHSENKKNLYLKSIDASAVVTAAIIVYCRNNCDP